MATDHIDMQLLRNNHAHELLQPQPSMNSVASIGQRTHLIEQLIGTLDPTPTREGLRGTPLRAAIAWAQWVDGYHVDIAELLKTFEDGAQGYRQAVIVDSIPVYSHCEHHLAPIFGYATVGYIPHTRVLGLSKMPRLVDAFARRLQVQERMTVQVAEALWTYLKPKCAGVIVKARHMCMESRGIKQTGGCTTTSHFTGSYELSKFEQRMWDAANQGAKP
jgi:GTP cyclohydrolase IA